MLTAPTSILLRWRRMEVGLKVFLEEFMFRKEAKCGFDARPDRAKASSALEEDVLKDKVWMLQRHWDTINNQRKYKNAYTRRRSRRMGANGWGYRDQIYRWPAVAS